MDFPINCYSEIFAVLLLELTQMVEMVYMSSHSSGVLRYVLHSCIDGHLIGSLFSRLFQWLRLIVGMERRLQVWHRRLLLFPKGVSAVLAFE